MTIKRQWGCIRIEIQDARGEQPLEDRPAKLVIVALAEGRREGEIQCEGELGLQLAHLLHACVVLSGGDNEEWFVPNSGHPLHLRRHGRQIEIARYPAYASHSTAWLTEDGLYILDFGMLLESLSAAVEWVMQELPREQASDDIVEILIHQWEHAWQRFSRLATFRQVTLAAI
jgi:hypothetical protein